MTRTLYSSLHYSKLPPSIFSSTKLQTIPSFSSLKRLQDTFVYKYSIICVFLFGGLHAQTDLLLLIVSFSAFSVKMFQRSELDLIYFGLEQLQAECYLRPFKCYKANILRAQPIRKPFYCSA